VGLVGPDGGADLRALSTAWYAAYGSNTDAARFDRYLARCTERVEPLEDRAHRIDLPLYFAGTTTRWGDGGVAFVGPDRDPTPTTLARAWLLPISVIAEVGAQENGLPLDAAALDVEVGDHVAFPGRRYDVWRRCGDLDGRPVVTLTASVRQAPERAPCRAYADVVARGLRTTHGLSPESVAEYLAPRTNLPFTTLMEWQVEGQG
jgi:hypothetical protein